MALSAADLNQARVNILGTTVDAPGATWTVVPPASANTLNTTARIITRAINELNTGLINAASGTSGFDDRFNDVIGNEASVDQAAFTAIGSNLIQAVATLMAGGAVVPPPLVLAFEFSDPLTTNDFVDVTVAADCTIPADLVGTQYSGVPETTDMHFELTEQPAADVIGEIEVAAGNVVTMTGLGGEIAAGTVLRMTAIDIVGGSIAPTAIISIAAERRVTPPAAVGRFEFEQTVASTTWTIQHMLNQRFVSVQVVDTGGTVLVADVDYDSVNRCILTFVRPKAGTAVVRT